MGLAEQAHQHWRRFLPRQYAQIPAGEREDFFLDLAMQARTRIAELAEAIAGPDLPGESGPDKLGRLNQAQAAAQEQVIREMILPDPETLPDPAQVDPGRDILPTTRHQADRRN